MKINRSLLNISIVYSLLGCNTSSVTDDLNKKNVINQFNFNQNEDVTDKNISNDDQTKFLEDQKNRIGLNNLSNTADKDLNNSIDNINKNNNDNNINGQPKTPSTNGTLNNNKPENFPQHSTLDPIFISPSPSIPTPPNYTSPGKTAKSPELSISSELSAYSGLNNVSITPSSPISVAHGSSFYSNPTSQNSIYDSESSSSHSAVSPDLIKTGKNNSTNGSEDGDESSEAYYSYDQNSNEAENSESLVTSSLIVSPPTKKSNKAGKTVSFAENTKVFDKVPKQNTNYIDSELWNSSNSNKLEFGNVLPHNNLNPVFSTIMDDSSFKINETDSVTMNWQYTNGYSTNNNSAMSNSTENDTNINEKFDNITINSKPKNKKEKFYQDNKLKITGASPLFYIKEGNETMPVYKQSDIEKLRFETCNNSSDENKVLNIKKIGRKISGNFRIGDDRQTIIKKKDLQEKEIKTTNITLETDEIKKNIKTNIGIFNDEGRYCFVCFQKDHKKHGSKICKLKKFDKEIFDVETDYWIIIFYNKVEEIKVLSSDGMVFSPAIKIDIKNSTNHVAFPIKKMNLRKYIYQSKFISFGTKYESLNPTLKKETYNVISILGK